MSSYKLLDRVATNSDNNLKFVDETMSEVRRNWNVTTQDDVSFF